MRKLLILSAAVLFLSSCATAFQQIATISSPQMKVSDSGHFAYNENDIVIDYNFWAQNGQVSFVITNNTDSDVYVDLGRSFLIVNGMTFDYYQNRTFSSSSTSTLVSSTAYGSSSTFARANAAAGAYATAIGDAVYGSAFGSSYGTSGTSAFSRRTTSSSTVHSGVEY